MYRVLWEDHFSYLCLEYLSKLEKLNFSSWMFLSKSRTVMNSLFYSILSDTYVEAWATCFLMYRRTLPFCHHLMIKIVSGATPERCVMIAAPERRERAPISMGLKPNRPLPRICTAALHFVRITAEVIVNLFPFLSMKFLT